jgi:thymidylate kinase
MNMRVVSDSSKLRATVEAGSKRKNSNASGKIKTVNVEKHDEHIGLSNRDVELDVTRKLINTLNAKGIRYCHWKSNIRLQDTLAGREDIDLLVHRADAQPFREAMVECGFKPAQSRSGIGHPGVFHALSLDEESGKLAHLHAYHHIVSGDSLVKNYRFKIEDALLGATTNWRGVTIPTREAELVLFAIRIALKHVSPVEIMMVNRHYQDIADEMAWLLKDADREKVSELCAAFFPQIKPHILQKLITAIVNRDALTQRIMLGWHIAWALRGQTRLGMVAANLSRSWRVCNLLLNRFLKKRDLILQNGGLVVALVGPKATGKSTLSAALAKTLGGELNVMCIHAGKPPATLLTFPARIMIPLGRRIFRNERPSEYQKPERRQTGQFSLLHVFHMTLLAYERRALLRKSFRMAAAGDIIISDRYPSASTGAIDSSGFDDAAIANTASLPKKWLMTLERAIYTSIPKPDLVIRLLAPIETSIERDASRIKPGGPDEDAVLRRRAIEAKADFSGVKLVSVDTNRSIKDTVRDVVGAVWAAL